jgi:hypothetical protein
MASQLMTLVFGSPSRRPILTSVAKPRVVVDTGAVITRARTS